MLGVDTSLCPLDRPVIAHVKTGCTVRSPELRIKACQSRLLEVGSDLCRLPKIFEGRIEKKNACKVNVAYTRMYFHIRDIICSFFSFKVNVRITQM